MNPAGASVAVIVSQGARCSGLPTAVTPLRHSDQESCMLHLMHIRFASGNALSWMLTSWDGRGRRASPRREGVLSRGSTTLIAMND
jgi:hypothetical protein